MEDVVVAADAVAAKAVVEVPITPAAAARATIKETHQGSSIAGTTNQGAKQNNMGPPANIYAQDTHAVDPVLVNNWGNADNASVESSLFSRTPRNGSTIIQN